MAIQQRCPSFEWHSHSARSALSSVMAHIAGNCSKHCRRRRRSVTWNIRAGFWIRPWGSHSTLPRTIVFCIVANACGLRRLLRWAISFLLFHYDARMMMRQVVSTRPSDRSLASCCRSLIISLPVFDSSCGQGCMQTSILVSPQKEVTSHQFYGGPLVTLVQKFFDRPFAWIQESQPPQKL